MVPRRSIPLLTAALTLGVLTASAACGSPPNPNNTATSTTTSQALGSSSPTGGASANPGTSPSPVVTSPAPDGGGGGPDDQPHSTQASQSAYVWSYTAGASYTAVGSYQFNSSGGSIKVTHLGTGQYRVSFAGLGASAGGVAHAQAYGNNAYYCTVDRWFPSGGAMNIDIRCFNSAAALVDTQLLANFARGSEGSARFSYLWANDAGAVGVYSPSATYRYDAVDSAATTVQRLSTGRYEVYLAAAGPVLSGPNWIFQITAYGTAYRCKEAGYLAATRRATVECRTNAGVLADSRFSLSFASNASILGRTSPAFYVGVGVAGGPVSNPSTGVYIYRLLGLPAEARGHVVAQGALSDTTYCHTFSWYVSAAELVAKVVCFAPGGAPSNATFNVAATF
jgi:hypothetical protein